MVRKFFLYLVFELVIAGFLSLSFANTTNNISLATGGAYNIPLEVHITQTNQQAINFTGQFDTKPFATPPYYQLRYTHWQNDKRGWGIEFIHHKLYLQNPPSDVQQLTITNGYNLITGNLAWRTFSQPIYYVYRLGLGIVFSHPESTIRGKKFDESGGLPWIDSKGYYISGPVGIGAIAINYQWLSYLSFFIESKLALSYVKVPIAEGHAKLGNISLHLLGGVSYGF